MKVHTKTFIYLFCEISYNEIKKEEAVMDERSVKVLNELLRTSGIEERLTKKLNVTKRQLDYSFEKINYWLEESGFQQLYREKGEVFLPDQVRKEIVDHHFVFPSYIFSSDERVSLIILLILTRKRKILLSDLSDKLEVTKNTILKDLKTVRAKLKSRNLRLSNDRSEGYSIEGKEWDKRNVLKNIIVDLSRFFGGIAILKEYLSISNDVYDDILEKIYMIEDTVGIKYTDQTMQFLPLFLIAILRRITEGKLIDIDFHVTFKQFSDTKEYNATNILLDELKENVSVSEKTYITLQIISSQSMNRDVLTSERFSEIRKRMKEFILYFEFKSVVDIGNKQSLLEKLLDHFIPAYYRIKYKLTTNYTIGEAFPQEFHNIYLICKKAIQPLEKSLKISFPEEEIKFLSLIVGGHIIGESCSTDDHKDIKAIIVCPSGVTFSQLLKNDLKQIFPKIYFGAPISVREFETYEEEVDIVFSSVPLATHKPLFVINELMTEDDKKKLRYQVNEQISLMKSELSEIDKIVSIVKKHTGLENEEKLRFDLANEYFFDEEEKMSSPLSLANLLSEDNVVIVDQVRGWEEAIEIAARPLQEAGNVTSDYLEKIKNHLSELLEYAVLQEKIVIPHLGPEETIREMMLSLLYIKQGIFTPKGLKIYFVLMIAPIDKEQHLPVLVELINLMGDTEKYHQLLNAETPRELVELIENHSGKEVG
ncbi:hypothetical protein CBF27_01420 [Vagococcus acidifermentans]|uniref:Ascorbate-specific PTS system EIIA component n=2 Tax=Vagococcus acidifermentans TaxID=564710 RepID=A0A430B2Y5_9ENTE|nr:hypothetical protein CBF27_01420 [Vagococcus acidifermentans]